MAKVLGTDCDVSNALKKLAGSKVAGQGREPSWFHPFPARMPVSVAHHLIESLTTSDAVILDPMMGSGTTLIAAKQIGRRGIGFDRDYLAVRISRCATHDFDSDRLHQLRRQILEQAEAVNREKRFRLPEERKSLPEEDQEFIRYWFPSRSQKQLFSLAKVIHDYREGPEKDFAWVVFSSLIVAKSAGASYALDISRSRPHKRDDKPIVLPLDGWDRRFRSAMSRLPFLNCEASGDVQIQQGDARHLVVKDASIDFVLTSPPYRNAVDYLRSHKFSLVWMGHDLESLRELRGTMVGTERGLWSLDGLPESLEQRLKRSVREDRRRALLRRYLSDIRQILAETNRVLRPGGLAVLVVGPTMINARNSDAAETIWQIGKSVGLRAAGSAIRQLNSERRSLPPPGTTGQENSLSNRMRREVIVALRK